MSEISEMLKKFGEIKTLPHVAIHLAKMISDDGSTIDDFEKIINLDPTLVMRLLKLVNSSYFSLVQKVSSISEALVYIGMETLRNMVVIAALKDIFNNKEGEEVYSRKSLWMHCAVVSICSKMISERIFGQNGDDSFLSGIFHETGIIVIDQVQPESIKEIFTLFNSNGLSFPEAEKKVVGTNHCEVGFNLARDWKLPEDVQMVVKDHHHVDNKVDPSSITGIVQIAEYLAARSGYPGIAEEKGSLSQSLLEHIRQNIKEYKLLARDLPDELNKAKEIYELSGE